MASTIGTNVVVDGSEELQLLEKILSALEERWLNKPSAEDKMRSKMAALLRKQMGGGHHVEYLLVSAKFAFQMEQLFRKHHIGYSFMADANGDFVFMVSDAKKELAEQMQADLYATSVENVRQMTPESLFKQSQRLSKDKTITQLSFGSREAFLIAQQKIYDAGVVCAVSDFGDDPIEANEKKIYGTITIQTSSRNCLKDSVSNDKPRGFTWYEMQFAIDQLMGDMSSEALRIREKQAVYDETVYSEFIHNMQEGVSCVLGSQILAESETHSKEPDQYFEFDGKNLVWKYKEGGEWQHQKMDIYDRQGNLTKKSELRTLILKKMGTMNNKAVAKTWKDLNVTFIKRADMPEGRPRLASDLTNSADFHLLLKSIYMGILREKKYEPNHAERVKFREALLARLKDGDKVEEQYGDYFKNINKKLIEANYRPLWEALQQKALDMGLDINGYDGKHRASLLLAVLARHMEDTHEKGYECIVDELKLNDKTLEKIRADMKRAEQNRRKADRESQTGYTQETERQESERNLDLG